MVQQLHHDIMTQEKVSDCWQTRVELAWTWWLFYTSRNSSSCIILNYLEWYLKDLISWCFYHHWSAKATKIIANKFNFHGLHAVHAKCVAVGQCLVLLFDLTTSLRCLCPPFLYASRYNPSRGMSMIKQLIKSFKKIACGLRSVKPRH